MARKYKHDGIFNAIKRALRKKFYSLARSFKFKNPIALK